MTLSCSCEDFDKGDYDHWLEPSGVAVPPIAAICCECGVLLPGDPCESIDHVEVYDPEESPPRDPSEAENDESVTDEQFRAIEDAWDDYRERNGWDFDTDRFTCVTHVDYRCERCSDLASSIEALGYCMIGPGDLISAHLEFIEVHGYARRKWIPDATCMLNPHPWTRFDYARDRYRRARYEISSWLRWKLRWKINTVKWRVIYAIRRAFA